MGTEVETCQQLGIGPGNVDTKYLFFGDELYVGNNRYEEHNHILATSDRAKNQVLVAGGLSVFKQGDIIGDIIYRW